VSEKTVMAPLRIELTAARLNLDKVDAALERADEYEAQGDKRKAWQQLTAANALLNDTRRVTSMLIRDLNTKRRELKPARREAVAV